MNLARSFPPIEGEHVHTLILGTMPGQASLNAVEYYAHPRNAFWPVMMAIIAKGNPDRTAVQALGYPERCQRLMDNGYGVWDVLAQCDRPGSLDSNISRDSERPNDIDSLLHRHPELLRIACNGKTACRLLTRHHADTLSRWKELGRELEVVTLPSTSPAMASLSLAMKHQRWAEGLLG